MKKLVFDIETIGVDYESLDEPTKENLTRWIKREAESEGEYKVLLEDLKQGLGFSPLTGEVAAIGVLDPDTEKGAVYFQAPGYGADDIKKQIQDNSARQDIKYEIGSEKEILGKFWQVASFCNEFISFNGRGFDGPFLTVRSAIHRIKATKDLMSNRYLGSQKFNARHIDLLDQLTFYGAVRRKGSLHLWCNAFSIKSPKTDGVTGNQVGELFKNKEYLKIAEYNIGDLRATKELYDYWNNYIRM